MLRTVSAAVLMLLSFHSYAQYTVSGVVRDAKTNQVLPGASVMLEESKQQTASDQFGRFRFDKIRSGKYSLNTSFIGYTKKVESIAVESSAVDVVIALEQTSILTEAVVVNATRATDKTPTTFTTVEKQDIQQQNFGQDLPFLINWTPSVVSTSDAGAGVGYTGIRIRGSDGTRINVTINGIPYNDAESLGTFWVDVPDIASSSQSIQIQRGVGTSTNGAGAFGATINLQTNIQNDRAYAEVVNAVGSFQTRKHTFSFGSGLLNGHWSFEGRVSKINSNGFIDRAAADLSSYYFSGGYQTDNTLLKAVIFGGKERTYQAWYGVPESKLNNDNEAMLTTAMNEGWNEAQTENLLNSNRRTFNPYTYQNQVDDYRQDHYQLHFSHQFSDAFTWNTALHYTPGKGYYEEYRYDQDLADYGLKNIIIDDDGNATDNDTISSVDLIRRRWLENDFYGFTYSLNYDKNNWNTVLGGGWNRYDGDHFGEILWADYSVAPHEYRYYLNNGDKRDFNTYLKTNLQVSTKINAFIDLQYRRVTYRALGIENTQNEIDVDAEFNFFNPKAGLTIAMSGGQQLYGFIGLSNREPVRADFVDFPGNKPESEKLTNVEIGYRHAGKNHSLNINYYHMAYKDQLVLTGQLNDVGASIRRNAGESYRMGLEVESALRLSNHFQWNANFTISRNKIKSYTELLEDYGENFDEFNVIQQEYNDTDISFSPSLIAGSQLKYLPFAGAEVALLTKYVGRQYLDNTQNEERAIDPYLVNDIRLSYTWKPSFIREISFSFLVNNILDEVYESNGYTWGYLAGSTEYRENYYYPQAGRNFMGMISLRF
jgi:iron complex outermembrane receptor protein